MQGSLVYLYLEKVMKHYRKKGDMSQKVSECIITACCANFSISSGDWYYLIYMPLYLIY
jgi:hypothetical protein